MLDRSKETVAIYDKISKKYSEIFDKDLSDLPFLDKFLKHVSKDGKILDLGCGTGMTSKAVLEKDKRSRITALDKEETMIEQAKKKLSRHKNRIEYICGDGIRYIKRQKPETIDAIISGLMIHNIPKRLQK